MLQTPVLFATAPLHKLETARERKSAMHLAIISDIHGNCFAFDQVLKEIRQRGIEHLMCLGDALQGGASAASRDTCTAARTELSGRHGQC